MSLFKVAMWLTLAAEFAAAQQGDTARQIWDNYFGASRTPSKSVPSPAAAPAPKPLYRRVPAPVPKQTATKSSTVPSPNAPGAALGVTIWKMETPTTGDTARLLVQEGPARKEAEYTPHRLESNEALHPGDMVRLAIETPSDGWLYVVDQELYTGDKLGAPYLIFPARGARRGQNRIEAAHLITDTSLKFAEFCAS